MQNGGVQHMDINRSGSPPSGKGPAEEKLSENSINVIEGFRRSRTQPFGTEQACAGKPFWEGAVKMMSKNKETSMAHTNFRSALQGANEIEITVTGRSSGRSLTYPVWFALEGDKLSLLPVKGSDTDWYKNLRKTPIIRLAARGKTFTTSARLLTDEAQIGKVLEK